MAWEYLVKVYKTNNGETWLGTVLDNQGRQHWELVSFDFQSGTAIFKRPVKEAK